MRVRYSEDARRKLKKMPMADADALVAKIERFASTGYGDVKKLAGEPFFRLRHGNWRAVLDLVDDVYVVRVAHRREVYR